MLFRLTTDTSRLIKKANYNKNFLKLPKILDHNHEKLITTQTFSKLTAYNFAPRSAQAKLVTNADIDDFKEKTDFDDKLKYSNKKVTSKKIKHIKAEKKLTALTNKVAQISEKGRDCKMYFTVILH